MARRRFLPHIWIASFLGTFMLWSFSDASAWRLLYSGRFSSIEYAIPLTVPFLCFILNMVSGRFRDTGRYGGIFGLWALAGAFYFAGAADLYLSILGGDLPPAGLVPMWVLALLCIVLLFTVSEFSLKERVVLTLMVLLSSLVLLPYGPLNGGNMYLTADLLGAAFSLSMLLLLGIFFILRNKRRLFNLTTLLMGLRFLVVYFQVFG